MDSHVIPAIWAAFNARPVPAEPITKAWALFEREEYVQGYSEELMAVYTSPQRTQEAAKQLAATSPGLTYEFREVQVNPKAIP